MKIGRSTFIDLNVLFDLTTVNNFSSTIESDEGEKYIQDRFILKSHVGRNYSSASLTYNDERSLRNIVKHQKWR